MAEPEGDTQKKQAMSEDIPRRQGFKNFLLAIRHIHDATVADNVKQRFSDYITIALVVLCILSLMVLVTFQIPVGLKIVPLLLTVVAILCYIINRMGIIISLTARQALIVWQILVAGFWLGVTSSMLVMIVSIYLASQYGF